MVISGYTAITGRYGNKRKYDISVYGITGNTVICIQPVINGIPVIAVYR